MTRPVPQGYKLAGVYCGIKRKSERPDFTMIVSESDASAAGVYTKNLVFAAPVALDRQRTPGSKIRVIAVNSGNANACTGDRGMADAQRMAQIAAQSAGASEDQALILSTGIIGEFLPLDKITKGIMAASKKLGSDEEALISAAKGFMTTDTVHKISTRTLTLGGKELQITGIAKGAAMIGPNMATMLSVLLTDAKLSPENAQRLLSDVVQDSFNCLSIDGHMSTNDTVLFLANGAAGGDELKGADLGTFRNALAEVASELARKIADDGEGATHLVTLEIAGCASRDAAQRIARSVANSPLVKTAIAGADPNWGRIVSAAGYAGVPFDPMNVTLHVQGNMLYQKGQPVAFDAAVVSAAIRDNRETNIVLRFGEGSHGVRFWTTDLTAEYVRLNADYHT